MRERRVGSAAWLWVAWLVTRFGLIVVAMEYSVIAGLDIRTDVTNGYFPAAQHLMSGLVPYRDFQYEYPPGTLPFLAAGWLLGGHTATAFLFRWLLLMVLLDGLVLHALLRGGRDRWAPAAWLAGGAALFPAFVRNDMVPTAAYVLGVVALLRGRQLAGGLSWGVGFVAKLWPGVAALGLVLMQPRRRWVVAAGFAAVAALATVLLAVPDALHPMLRYLDSYQGHRPIEIESTWANVQLLDGLAHGAAPHSVGGFGSMNLVTGPAGAFAHAAHVATAAVQVLAVLAPLAVRRLTGRVPSAAVLAWLFASYLAASLLVTSVLSAQYLLWLLGSVCVVVTIDPGPRSRVLAATGVAACAVTTVVFPYLWLRLTLGQAWAVSALTVRTALIAVVLVVALAGVRDAVRATSRAQPADGAGRCPRR